MLASLIFQQQSIHAEGSRDLVEVDPSNSSKAYRPYLEWLNDSFNLSGVKRQTHLRVLVKEGEKLLLGSSVTTNFTSNSATPLGDIVVRKPDGTSLNLDVKSTGEGYISSYSQETKGPTYTINGTTYNSGGYKPIEVDVDQTGEWIVEFRGNGDTSSSNPGANLIGTAWDQKTSGGVAAWDVTVIDPNRMSPEIPGRMYTYSLALNIGVELKNGSGAFSSVYVLTKDGYLYKSNMNGMDPFGFVFFSNNSGFIDISGSVPKTLYHSVSLDDVGKTGSKIIVQNPFSPDTDKQVTHRVFFNEPADDLGTFRETGGSGYIKTTPDIPPVIAKDEISDKSTFSFNGYMGNSTSNSPVATVGSGGEFSFELSRSGSYQIILDTDGTPGFDPSTDTVIEDSAASGKTVFKWNGKNRNNTIVPAGKYAAKLLTKGGEYHFPMLDVERAPNGIIIEMLNKPADMEFKGLDGDGNPISPTTVYYEDSSPYYLQDGTMLSLPAANHTPENKSKGVNSVNGAHKFLGDTAGYGNNKAIDTWTYFPGDTAELTFYVTNSTVSGNVYEDSNSNGVKDASEKALSGIRVDISVELEDAAGVIQYSAVTDANGSYSVPVYLGEATVSIDPSQHDGLKGKATTQPWGSEKVVTIGSNVDEEIDFSYVLIIRISQVDLVTAPEGKVITNVKPTIKGQVTDSGVSKTVSVYLVDEDGELTLIDSVTSTGDGNWEMPWPDDKPALDSGEVTLVAITQYGTTGNEQDVEARVTFIVNRPPTAEDDVVTTKPGQSVTITLDVADDLTAVNDLSYNVPATTSHGTLIQDQTDKNKWVYTPANGFSGTDTFTYEVTDAHGLKTEATITVQVDGAPTVQPKQGKVNAGGSVTITLEGSDDLTSAGDLVYNVPAATTEGGTLTQDPANPAKVTYTPKAGFSGTDTFTYTVIDNASQTSTAATVTITVNGKPAAEPVTGTVTNENTDTVITLGGTDDHTAEQDLVYSLSSTTTEQGGTLTQDENEPWKITYTPAKDFTGTDTFSYTVTDEDGLTSATVTVTVTVNAPPTVEDDSVITKPGQAVTITLDVADDLTAVNDLSYNVPATTGHGTLVQDQTDKNKWVYTPANGFSGTDTFMYEVTDAHGLKAEATITVQVDGAPTAQPKQGKVNAGGSVTITLEGSDDLTAAGDLVYNVPATTTEGGTLTQDPANPAKVTYTPKAGFSGTDTFTYTVTDNASQTSTAATVTITVNGKPAAEPVTGTVTNENTDTVITLGGTDDHTAEQDLVYSLSSTTTEQGGTLTQDENEPWKITYTPAEDFTGTDTFSYTVTDEDGLTSATVTVTVTVNAPPTAEDDSVITKPGQAVTITLDVADDLTAVNDLSYNVPATTSHGTLVQDQTDKNKWVYTPANGFSGTDTFTYEVTDAHGLKTEATITVQVDGAPTAQPKQGKVNAGGSITITLEGSDDLTLAGDLVYNVPAATTEGGTLTPDPENPAKVVYTPKAGFSGTDTFTYTVTDNASQTSTAATVTITVNGKPTAEPVTGTVTNENTDTVITLGGTDDHTSEQDLVYSLSSNTTEQGGTLTQDENEPWKITYTPAKDFTGADTFSYTVTDEDGLTSATVTVTVTVKKPLDGWVGQRQRGELTPLVVLRPGSPLKLSAVSVAEATKVVATVTYKVKDASGVEHTKTDVVTMTASKTVSDEKNSYKLWSHTTYRLADNAITGSYSVTYEAFNGADSIQTEPSSLLSDNSFYVVSSIDLVGTIVDDEGEPLAGVAIQLYDPTGTYKYENYEATTDAEGNYRFDNIPTNEYLIAVKKPGYSTKERNIDTLPSDPHASSVREDFALVNFRIELKADPSSIVGDGKTTTWLTAVVTDKDGKPMAGIEVEFSAGTDSNPVGTFLGDTTVVTDSKGQAKVQYRSSLIEGIISQKVPVKATVDDTEHHLYDWEQIFITFEPASVSGIVTSTINGEYTVVPGALVKLTKDFDGDGIIDFSAETTSDSDGKYTIAVPRGDVSYDLEIYKPIEIGRNGSDEPIIIPFKQKVWVDEVTGSGGDEQDYPSTKTATGIVGIKDAADSSKSQLFTEEELQQFRVYLKKPDNTYVTNPDNGQNWFALDDNGVFNIPGLDKGTEYQLEIRYTIEITDPDNPNYGDVVEIAFNQKPQFDADGNPVLDGSGQQVYAYPTIKLDEDGELNILEELVDPYGDVLDSSTLQAIPGATVTLYYYPKDINGNLLPVSVLNPATDQKVYLPAISGFLPFDNQSPSQVTGADGKYAYMVYPNTDYYLYVTAPGYFSYNSGHIRVDWDIVRHNVHMDKIPVIPTAPPVTPPPVETSEELPELVVNIAIEQSKAAEETEMPITVTYQNIGDGKLKEGTVTMTLPEGFTVVDADGGKVEGNKISWTVHDVDALEKGTFTVMVKSPQLKQSEEMVTVTAEISTEQKTAGIRNAAASVKMKLVSNRFGAVQHIRYILGYPDGEFKPGRNLTRAELAAIVARLLGGGEDGSIPYTDVAKDHWAHRYIYIASKNGIFEGDPTGSFRPEDPVKREELAAVMARFIGMTVSHSIDGKFSDVEGRWSEDAIEALLRGGLISGYPDGTFKPGNKITRLEAVAMINSMLFRGPLVGVDAKFPDVPESSWGFGHALEATVSHEATWNADGTETFVRELEDKVD
ncbi:Ig-like domain-containing protein [Paenibacillus nanensis]|nr:Ig-like domain-containing protein [Paenibacillus nanensis]